jgi:hypothetical protein
MQTWAEPTRVELALQPCPKVRREGPAIGRFGTLGSEPDRLGRFWIHSNSLECLSQNEFSFPLNGETL